MAYGIWCKPVGPGPATPPELFIDSGSTFPQFKNSVSGSFNYNGGSRSFPISGWDGTGNAVILPTGNLCWDVYEGTDLIPTIYCVTGISVSSSTAFNVSLNLNPGSNPLFSSAFNVYQIWPRANQNYGITFSNTANYFSISDSGVVGQCIYAWEGTINGSFQIPAISGFDMSRAVVFANWSSTSAGLLYTSSNRTVTVYQNRTYDNGNTNQTGSISNVRLAVFCNGSSVPVHNGGLNIYSPNGQSCVFSTYRTPFIVNNFMPYSGGSTGLSYPMIPLSSGVGAIRGSASGNYYQHARSHMMNGSSFSSGFGRYMFQWENSYDLGSNATIGISVPVLDATKYFASI